MGELSINLRTKGEGGGFACAVGDLSPHMYYPCPEHRVSIIRGPLCASKRANTNVSVFRNVWQRERREIRIILELLCVNHERSYSDWTSCPIMRKGAKERITSLNRQLFIVKNAPNARKSSINEILQGRFAQRGRRRKFRFRRSL